jgi:hypothetical protein
MLNLVQNLKKEENPKLLDLAADWYDEEMIKENTV